MSVDLVQDGIAVPVRLVTVEFADGDGYRFDVNADGTVDVDVTPEDYETVRIVNALNMVHVKLARLLYTTINGEEAGERERRAAELAWNIGVHRGIEWAQGKAEKPLENPYKRKDVEQ